MYRDFTVALEDQVDALHAVAQRFGFLDLDASGCAAGRSAGN